MHAWIRVTVTTVLAVTCLDGHAKVVDRCIQTLEARAVRPDATSPRPCPIAIGYAPRADGSVLPTIRAPFDARGSRPVGSPDSAMADTFAPSDPALHA